MAALSLGACRARRIVSWFAALLILLMSASLRADTPPPAAKYHEVVFDSAASDGGSLDALDPAEAIRANQATLHVLVPDTNLQAQLNALRLKKGDLVAIETLAGKDGHDTLKSVRPQFNDVSLSHALFVFVVCCGLYLVVCLAITLGNPLKLILGEDGHYSNSKFQMFVWFGILISAYLAAVFSKAVHMYYTTLGNVAIPNNLLLLSGMSALTFAGAKGITTSKVQAALDAGILNPKPRTDKPNFLYDLTHNDRNQLDFGDFQMIVVTLVAVGMYIVLILHHLGSMELRASTTLPDVDSTILASFGLGQGAYLTKKAVGNVGDT